MYSGNVVEQSEYIKDSAKTLISTTYTFKSSGELEKYNLRNFRFRDNEETTFTYDSASNTLNREGWLMYDPVPNLGSTTIKFSTKYIFDNKKGMMLNVSTATPWWWFAAKYNLAYTSSFMFFSLVHNVAEVDDTNPSNNNKVAVKFNYTYDTDGYPASMNVITNNVETVRYTFKYVNP
jgi:hypothetical protein